MSAAATNGGPRFVVTAYPVADVVMSSSILAGLFELERQRIVALSFRPGLDKHRRHAPMVLRLDIRGTETGLRRRVALDVHDSAAFFSMDDVERCDLYYKRNLIPDELAGLAGRYHARIRPAGLTFGVRSPHEHHVWFFHLQAVLSAIVHGLAGAHDGKNKGLLVALSRALRSRTRRYRGLLRTNDFEMEPDPGGEPVILFQTRSYDPAGGTNVTEDVQRVNEQRASVIRSMRSEFGERFIGGFVPDAYTRTRYPDCLANLQMAQKEYLALVRKAAIVIYTRGLSLSPAWKLAEYFAAGKCIVADAIPCRLPRALKNGEEIVFFDSTDQCVQVCKELLDQPDRIRSLSVNAKRYYEDSVKPSALVLRVLENSFQAAPALC